MSKEIFGIMQQKSQICALADRIISRRIQEQHEQNRESYCIHTKAPDKVFSNVVRKSLEDFPLKCRRR